MPNFTVGHSGPGEPEAWGQCLDGILDWRSVQGITKASIRSCQVKPSKGAVSTGKLQEEFYCSCFLRANAFWIKLTIKQLQNKDCKRNSNNNKKVTSSFQPSSGLYLGDLNSGEQPHFTYPFTETPRILKTFLKCPLTLRDTKWHLWLKAAKIICWSIHSVTLSTAPVPSSSVCAGLGLLMNASPLSPTSFPFHVTKSAQQLEAQTILLT